MFRCFIDGMRLIDLGFKGPNFSWNNRRDVMHNIQERLDCSLATFQWFQLYPNALLTT